MSMEEQDLIRSAVKEFAQKAIQDRALKIEHEGIDQALLQSLAAQGFLGARIPEKYGGSGIDLHGYLTIINELATYSPSVSALVMLVNSVHAALIGDSDPEMMKKLAAGEATVAAPLSDVLEGSWTATSLQKNGNKLNGKISASTLSKSQYAIVFNRDDGHLYLFRSGVKALEEDLGLSFRGLSNGSMEIDSSDFTVLSEKGQEALKYVVDSLDLEIAAIALGTAKGALDKAIDYVKVRKTFERPLKDYGPVANGLSKLMAEYLALSSFMDAVDEKDGRGRLSLKVLSVDFAKRATKAALQYHGGYGYIEDTGVEKFYRDAMGLSILFQLPHHDSMRLSKEIFGEKSGYL